MVKEFYGRIKILLEKKGYVKYIGVLILIQTSLGSNIYYLSPQRSANILELFQGWDTDTLLSIYRSLIQPHIT